MGAARPDRAMAVEEGRKTVNDDAYRARRLVVGHFFGYAAATDAPQATIEALFNDIKAAGCEGGDCPGLFGGDSYARCLRCEALRRGMRP